MPYEFATPLSQQVLQMRRRNGELLTPELNDSNRRLYGLPSQIVVREAFVADREGIVDSYQGERRLFREGQ